MREAGRGRRGRRRWGNLSRARCVIAVGNATFTGERQLLATSTANSPKLHSPYKCFGRPLHVLKRFLHILGQSRNALILKMFKREKLPGKLRKMKAGNRRSRAESWLVLSQRIDSLKRSLCGVPPHEMRTPSLRPSSAAATLRRAHGAAPRFLEQRLRNVRP